MKKTALIALLVTCSCMARAAQDTVNGRYVNVSLPGENRTLSLAEVQVFSGGENVALGKKTVQSSTGSSGESSRAVDGNTSGDWGSRTITHTDGSGPNPGWEVDLGKTIAIEKVAIWNRNGYEDRLWGARIAILDEKRKVVWGADLAQPGRGTEVVVKSHPAPRWVGKTFAEIGDRFNPGPAAIISSSEIAVVLNETTGASGSVESLRLAINDLIATFGNRYPKGKEYLARLDRLKEDDIEGLEKLGREALLANPLLDFEKLLVVKRRGDLGLPQNWVGNCTKKGRYDNEIAVLSTVRDGGKLTTLFRPEKDVFVGDVDLHWDAEKMIFSMPAEHNRYQVFEVGIDGEGLRQVSPTEPDIDNYDACYLPNEQIVFDSTACFQGVPCIGGGGQVANLYVMNPDGTGIRQLCFDQDHDWYPSVTNDGRVMFTRWEYSDTPHYFTRVVMRMNPDGTNQKALYGSNSYWPNSTFYVRAIPSHPSKFVGIISGHHGVPRMGELIIFDAAVGEQEADGVVQRIPGYGQKVEPIIRDKLVDNSWPKFLHPYPLSEKHFLVSCKISSSAPWGVYLVDIYDNMVPILVEQGVAMFEPVPLKKTPRPRVIPSKVDTSRKDAIVQVLDIYRGGGLKGVAPGTVKQLRLFAFDYGYHGLANHTYIGMEGPWDVHRILGTVDVETDGSATFHVPANVPIAVQPLDADGKALQLMRSWFVAMPGENLACIGCHEKSTDAPPRHIPIAAWKSPQQLKEWYGPARGFSFAREVQPALDKYCIGCHNGTPYKGKNISDLRHLDEQGFSRAYRTLQAHVRRPGPESDYHMMPTAEYHADSSPLIQMLNKGHYGVKLDREASERLYTWIDLNVPYFGTWGEFREIPRGQRERRADLRQLYAGIDLDYEVVPELPKQVIKPIIPKEPAPIQPVKIDLAGWPFDDSTARQLQGEIREKTITIEGADGQSFDIQMVRIPAGEFVMGDPKGSHDENPICSVKIERPFWISKAVITNAQYKLFDPEHDSRYLDRGGKDHGNRGNPLNRPEQPVIRISWERAMAFSQWMSKQTGKKYALPTEAQWEFACRGGATADGGSTGRTWGLSNMARMAEWTRTTYRPYPYISADGRDAGKPEDRKVVRGAKSLGISDDRRDTFRLSYHWWQGVWNVGFRIVCEDDEPALEEVVVAE